MNSVGTQDFGVRSERAQIDQMLGGIFAEAAKNGTQDPIVIEGPPFVLKAYSKPDFIKD
jgi:hypothetical protein